MNSLNREEWIKLWILDELQCRQLPTDWLTTDVVRQPANYWDFPRATAIEATVSERNSVLFQCIDDNLVGVISVQSMKSLDDCGETTSSADLIQTESENTWVYSTRQGFHQWQDLFEPDWDRWWKCHCSEHSFDPDQNIAEVHVTSASMFNELVKWLPSHYSEPHLFSSGKVDITTVMHQQLTCHKIAPKVKRITCSYQRARSESQLRAAELDAWNQMKAERVKPSVEAARAICRLSARWSCVPKEGNGLLLTAIDHCP